VSRTLLVSECLSGKPCRYHGRPDTRYRRRIDRIAAELQADQVVWVCPETLGGLPTPRPAGRRRRGRIWADGIVGGTDLTPSYERGAERAVALARKVRPCAIVLFAKSPSCDPEWGLAGRGLRDLGVPVIVLGDLRGRPHLVTPIGRLRHRLPDQRRLPEPTGTDRLFHPLESAK
jgi:uncharacterized protein YbbK (DUF523 family)